MLGQTVRVRMNQSWFNSYLYLQTVNGVNSQLVFTMQPNENDRSIVTNVNGKTLIKPHELSLHVLWKITVFVLFAVINSFLYTRKPCMKLRCIVLLKKMKKKIALLYCAENRPKTWSMICGLNTRVNKIQSNYRILLGNRSFSSVWRARLSKKSAVEHGRDCLVITYLYTVIY